MKQETKFKQTEIGMIPEDWDVKRLDEISDVVDCLHSKKPDKVKNGVVYLEVHDSVFHTVAQCFFPIRTRPFF